MYVFTSPVSERTAQARPPLLSPMALCNSPRCVMPSDSLLTPRQLTAQTQRSTIHQSSRAQSSIAAADAEIARFRDILRQIDDLETEFDKVRHIRDIVKGFRARVEGLERRVEGRGPAVRGRR